MGSNLSTQPQTNSTTESQIAPPDVVFDRPYFTPLAANILVIHSIFSMGGPSFVCALLYSPHESAGGIAIDGYGRVSTVPADRWQEMENFVRRAKEVWAELGNRSGWSTPTLGSCPVQSYYDLGPSENIEGLSKFQRSSYYVSAENLVLEGTSLSIPVPKRSAGIRTCKKMDDGKYEETTVKQIPEPITTLESALSKLQADLFSILPGHSYSDPEGVEAKAMTTAVKNMSSALRSERRMREQASKYFKRNSNQNGWFNWR
ncbi:hypothetical protein DFH09DRAFT_29989 [Mycena vulgaris]|nr:hypothetical protein DFH09DRAFT_29989 [Mycena vulgaris]